MPTILHLSDLHRSPSEPIDNDTLIASIVADIERYTVLSEKPDALIVSGDLVYGVRRGQANFAHEMRLQYDVAIDLIDRLCIELLKGDRSKIVIVPGNHDVCWNTSASAMGIVEDEEYPKALRRAISDQDSNYRWSWDERRLYKLVQNENYERRLEFYWDAVEKFYKDVGLVLPIDRRRGFNLFSLFEGSVLIAAFESTHRNDHLRYEAQLSTGVISRCAMKIRKLELNPSLLGAVWHHSVQGPPNKEDYLSIDAIREMAGLGFQIGFHGHQHLAESTDISVSIGAGSRMCVVSAGSLCAGWQDLPRGTDRQYNIVRINPTFDGGALHIREMGEGNQFVPRNRGRFLQGMAPLSWSPRVNIDGSPVASTQKKLRNITITVEEANAKGQQTEATMELLNLRPSPQTYPRSVLLQGLSIAGKWQQIWDFYWPTDEVSEAMMVAEACYQMADFDKLNLLLKSGKLPEYSTDEFSARLNLLKIRKDIP